MIEKMERWVVGQDSVESLIEYLITLETSDGNKPLICIDYFDTVVTRVVEPEYTKEIASELLSHLLGDSISGPELYQHRRNLEREIVESNDKASGELEFSLPSFSSSFYTLLKNHYPQLELGEMEAFVQTILDIEVTVETGVQRVCPQMNQVLNTLRVAGVSLILVSDFYLPGTYFQTILKSHGLDNVFEDLYVSMDHGKSKGSGKLYQKISYERNCPTANMVMIGDNEHADIKMAQEKGLKALLVSRPDQIQFYSEFRKKITESNGQQDELFSQLEVRGDFSEMASSFWLFCNRLFEDLSQKKAGNVFFLSKEGEFLKRLFDRYQLDLYGQLRIKSHYLLASRKATFLASLDSLEKENFLRLLAHYRDISIRDFLRSLNFGEELIDNLCSQLSSGCDEHIVDLRSSAEFKELLILPQFREQYEERRQQQRRNFRQYLDSFSVNYHDDGLFLVDVGWKGSIQDNIFYILEQETDVQGYFIGSFNPTELQEKNRKKGLLFENPLGESPFFKVYNNNRSLFEMILGASHGSADSYLTPKQFDNESHSAHLHVHCRVPADPDEILVLVLDFPEERVLYNTVISKLQENIYFHFSRFNQKYLLANCAVPSDRWFAMRHAKMVFTPTRAEVELFVKLYHLENFGIFGYTNFQSNEKMSVIVRLKNLRNVLRNPDVLESGLWPPIILRRLGLGFLQVLDGKRRYFREFFTFK